jgi:ABC-type sugar transport system substrate-binding protein
VLGKLRPVGNPTALDTKEPRRMSSTASIFRSAALAAFAVALGLAPLAAEAEAKKDFKVCWSIYVGWMPWGYIAESGIMDLHAK